MFIKDTLSTITAKEVLSKINNKTKPVGSLGILEDLALQICIIQDTLSPELNRPTILVFAGDHGIVEEGISLYPQEVTYQMVYNFLGGGAAINIFCKQNSIDLIVVDAGVNHDFSQEDKIRHAKIGKGTSNFLKQKAMTEQDCQSSLSKGAEIVNNIFSNGCNVVGFGEMGIGNTTSATALMSVLTGTPIEECTGRGTGLSDHQLFHKTKILRKAIDYHYINNDALLALQTFGGYEIAMMCGAMIEAAKNRMILLIDGFIATSALLVAYKLFPTILDNCIFCHQSEEKGHKKLLEYLQAKPIVNLNMRLGEGTGAAIAYPIIKSAVSFVNDMASFESAGIRKESEA